MTSEEKMTIDERYKYFRKMQKRYQVAGRREQGRLLDEMEEVSGLHRKSVVRLMNGPIVRQRRQKQRQRSYGAQVDDALRVIGESFDYICAERMRPNLVWMAKVLSEHGQLETTAELLDQLEQISVSTVGRVMKRVRQDERRLPRKRPETANQVARAIPMKRIAWQQAEPGHLEVDLVHHNGGDSGGQYVHTLQMVDVATGWSERVALLGRSYRVTEDGCRQIVARLPFQIQEIHPDNGSEFINHHLVHYWQEVVKVAQLSRSRPFHKNDNRFVEQKNWTLVRAYLGYQRLDSVAQTLLLNQLYQKMWLYYNFFQPVLRLSEKTAIRDGQQLIGFKRVFDQAQTPFDRLCTTSAISVQKKVELDHLRAQTNPRQLRREIYLLIDQLFALPNAGPDQTQDVFETLAYPELLLGSQKEA